MTHNDIIFFQKQLNNAHFHQIPSLKKSLQELRVRIEGNADGQRHKEAMDLFKRKLVDLEKEKKDSEEIHELEKSIRDVEKCVFNIKIPIYLNSGSFFEQLRKEILKVEQDLINHLQNCDCFASYNLLHSVKDVKDKIESLEKDNAIALGWLGASTGLGVASIGVAFIPVVGLPIAAIMNVGPYLGRLAHRLYESRSRRERFTQNDS